jgi:hypothetical protein
LNRIRISRMSSTAPAIDEYPIRQIPDTPLWSENFALVAVEGVKRASVFYSIGRWHADPTIWRENILMALPGGRIIFARHYGRNAPPNGPGASFSAFEVIRPEHELRLTYAGPVWESTLERMLERGIPEAPAGLCSLELVFRATGPVWNMRGDSAEASAMAGGLHIEQIGKAHAMISYRGEKFSFEDCYTIRDHSRGVRDPTSFKKHCWLNGDFPGRRSFFVYAMQFQGSDSVGMSNAVILEEGKFHPASVAHVEFISGAGDMRKPQTLILDSGLGRMEVNFAEVLTSIPMSFVNPFDPLPGRVFGRPSVIMFDEAVRLEWGAVHGLGWSERGVAPTPF